MPKARSSSEERPVPSDPIDDALALLEKGAKTQHDEIRQRRRMLLEIGLSQDLLRRDPSAVAKRVEALVALRAPADQRPAWTSEFRQRLDAFVAVGNQKGVVLGFDVAIALGEIMLKTAKTQKEIDIAIAIIRSSLLARQKVQPIVQVATSPSR